MLARKLIEAGGPFSVEFYDRAESSASTITVPAGVDTTDVAVLFDYGYNPTGDAGADVVPAGWTGLISSSRVSAFPLGWRARVSYKILTASDAGATVTGINMTTERKFMLVFRATAPIGSVTPSTWLSQSTENNPSSQAINASGQATPLIVLADAVEEDGAPTWATESPAFEDVFTNAGPPTAGDHRVGYTIYDYDETPANHTVDMADAGNANSCSSGYLILAP